MKNKIIHIGTTGNLKCYLNVSIEDACRRFIMSDPFYIEMRKKYNNLTDIDFIETHIGDIGQISFDDEFEAYHINAI